MKNVFKGLVMLTIALISTAFVVSLVSLLTKNLVILAAVSFVVVAIELTSAIILAKNFTNVRKFVRMEEEEETEEAGCCEDCMCNHTF